MTVRPYRVVLADCTETAETIHMRRSVDLDVLHAVDAHDAVQQARMAAPQFDTWKLWQASPLGR